MTKVISRKEVSRIKYTLETRLGLAIEIDPTTTVHINKTPPSKADIDNDEVSLVRPLKDEKMSGPPLARAINVTPAKE